MNISKSKSYEVLLIVGYGHSGTTILDIILGSSQNAQSCGEMTHITREFFFSEYCSCGNIIDSCDFWGDIIEAWKSNMDCSFENYVKYRSKFEGNKNYFRSFINFYKPSSEFLEYIKATELLYDQIFRKSKKKIIIDSSKSASRVFLLKRFSKVRLIHVCRNFRGVLNSEKKNIIQDLEKGIEMNSMPKKSSKVLKDWFISNMFCSISRIFAFGKKLHFNTWLKTPMLLNNYLSLSDVDFVEDYFKAEHMIAGNSIRMKPPQKLRRNIPPNYERLSRRQLLFGFLVEKVTPFWSK